MKIDFYKEFRLSRSSDCAALHAELTQRLSRATSVEDEDKLSTALKILGNPTRRALYDQDLDDPTITQLGVGRLKDIARMPVEQAPEPHLLSGGDTPTAPVANTSDAASQASQVTASAFADPSPQSSVAAAPEKKTQNWQAQASQLGKQITEATGPLQQSLQEAAGNLKNNPSWFAVDPKRQRSDSLMWAIVTGIIVMIWTVEGLKVLFFFTAASNTDSVLETFGLASAAEDLVLDVMVTMMISTVLLVLCQLIWNIRMVIGRRGWLDQAKS